MSQGSRRDGLILRLSGGPKIIDKQQLLRGSEQLCVWIMAWYPTIFISFGLFFFLVTKIRRVYYKIAKVVKQYNLEVKNSL